MFTALPSDWSGVPPAQAGPLGLLVIVLLGVAVFFLYKSLNKQLKKVPHSFDPPAGSSDGDDPPASG
jgi:L-asparagine transporter-like permease